MLERLKAANRLEILAEFGGTKSVKSIPKHFHHKWVHGDWKSLGNKSMGGKWNEWWREAIDAKGGYKGISKTDFEDIARMAEAVIQDQWVAYKRYVDK